MKPARFNFDPPGAYRSPYRDGLPGHRGQETELQAAVRALGTASEQWKRAYALIDGRSKYGLTDIEGQRFFFSFAKRRCDLYKQSPPLVFDSGLRRKTPRGADAIVWVTARNKEVTDAND